ncbi:MAG: NAD(P)-dependent glycerol-3-phosphate dehydrogenase [Verrucomicrobiae bacterium]|nr:NAD(P)-dependent glycerol-3-phosphate dehydrogenase [Verrucomicrobiae bacterium]
MIQPKKIGVLGTGSWGSALALTMAQQGHPIKLWGHNPHHVEEIKSSRLNPAYLPGIIFPSNIHLTSDLAECAEAEVIFFVVPSKFLRSVAAALSQTSPHFAGTIISCTKGIEHQSGKLMHEVLAEILPRASMAVLSGPNLAGDIARGLPAAGVLGCEDPALTTSLLSIFQETSYRAYSSSDIRGIQLGGALKNIFAIAAAVSDGLGMGENAKAGIVTRSLAEMTRLGTAMGGDRQTFSGLSGVGDLMVTCFSSRSRNYQAGLQLCHGKSASEIQHSMGMVAEGLPTAQSAQACAQKLDVEVPIIDAVVDLLHQKKTPQEAMYDLLQRKLRSEEEL